MTKRYDKNTILEGLRKDLSIKICEFAKSVMDLPEGEEKNELLETTFAEIFNLNSINTPDECLKEMSLRADKIVRLSISELENLLKCDRSIIIKTLKLLEMTGGMNGWESICVGKRRGKRYTLKKLS